MPIKVKNALSNSKLFVPVGAAAVAAGSTTVCAESFDASAAVTVVAGMAAASAAATDVFASDCNFSGDKWKTAATFSAVG